MFERIDLEAAKRGEHVCTREGYEAEFVAELDRPLAGGETIIVVVYGKFGRKVQTHYENGAFYDYGKEGSDPLDLVMAPTYTLYWVNAKTTNAEGET